MSITQREGSLLPLPAARAEARPHGGRAFRHLACCGGRPISRPRLFDVLSHRAFGALMLSFAAPSVLPTPPGFSSLLAAPLIFLAAQLALSRPAPLASEANCKPVDATRGLCCDHWQSVALA